MAVVRGKPVAVRHHDSAPEARAVAHKCHQPRASGEYRRSPVSGNVEPMVKLPGPSRRRRTLPEKGSYLPAHWPLVGKRLEKLAPGLEFSHEALKFPDGDSSGAGNGLKFRGYLLGVLKCRAPCCYLTACGPCPPPRRPRLETQQRPRAPFPELDLAELFPGPRGFRAQLLELPLLPCPFLLQPLQLREARARSQVPNAYT